MKFANNFEMGISIFDKKPATLQLNFSTISHYKSKAGGTISLIYYIVIAALIVFKIAQTVSKKQLTLTTFTTKGNDLQPLNFSTSNIRFIILKFEPGKARADPLLFQEQLSNGIHFTIQQSTLYQNEQGQNLKVISRQMKACHQFYFCMPDPTQDFPYNVLGRPDFFVFNNKQIRGQIIRKYTFNIKLCNKSSSPLCQQFGSKNVSLLPVLFFQNNLIQPSETGHDEVVTQTNQTRYMPSLSPLSKSQTIINFIYLKKAVIETDNEILPSFLQFALSSKKQISKVWFYDEEMAITTEQFQLQQQILSSYHFCRSVSTHVYARKFKRFDQMLGEIFGLLSIVAIVVFAAYRGYNDWSFQQLMRKQLNLSYVQPTLFKYYKHILKKALGWVLSFCIREKQDEIENERIEQQQLAEAIDVKKIAELVHKTRQDINSDNREQNSEEQQKQVEMSSQQCINGVEDSESSIKNMVNKQQDEVEGSKISNLQ